MIATQCAGIVISGANAAYTPKELEHQLNDSGAKVLLVHPSILEVALSATAALGWSKKKQRDCIVLAVQKNETGPAGDSKWISGDSAKLTSSNSIVYRSLNDIMTGQLLDPHPCPEPKTTVAYLGYSSGTSGKAKGVRTSNFNMTSVLSILTPIETTSDDIHLAVLPLNREH